MRQLPRWLWPAAAVLVITIAIVAAVFWLRTRSGAEETPQHDVVTAVPADALAYLALDWDALQTADVLALRTAFAEAAAADEVNMLAEWDTALTARTGVALPQDVAPWIGQQVGVALLDARFDAAAALTGTTWLLLAQARDAAAADAFLAQLALDWEARTGETAEPIPYQDITVTAFDNAAPADQLALARLDNLVLIGATRAAVAQSIDAFAAGGLAADGSWQTAQAQLPAASPLTAFLNLPRLDALPLMRWLNTSSFVLPPLPLDGLQAAAAAVTLNGETAVLDIWTIADADALSPAQTTLRQTVGDGRETAVFAPPQTVLFWSGVGVDAAWQTIVDDPDAADFVASLALLAQQFGFDLSADLFAYLDGPAWLTLLPGQSGLLPSELGLDAVTAVAADDVDALAANLEALAAALKNAPFGAASAARSQTPNGVTLYTIETALFPDMTLHTGTGAGHFVLGGSPKSIDAIPFAAEATPAWTAVWEVYEPPLVPTLYVDVATLLPLLRAARDDAWLPLLQPIATITGGVDTAVAANNPTLNHVQLRLHIAD